MNNYKNIILFPLLGFSHLVFINKVLLRLILYGDDLRGSVVDIMNDHIPGMLQMVNDQI